MPIASPCTKVCTIDPRSGLCLGCGRTLDEIGAMGDRCAESERRRIMSELPRADARGTGSAAPTGGALRS